MYGLKGLSLSEVITTVLAPFNTQYMNDVQVSRQFSNILTLREGVKKT